LSVAGCQHCEDDKDVDPQAQERRRVTRAAGQRVSQVAQHQRCCRSGRHGQRSKEQDGLRLTQAPDLCQSQRGERCGRKAGEEDCPALIAYKA